MLKIPKHGFFKIPLSIRFPRHMMFDRGNSFYFGRPKTQDLTEKSHHISIVIALVVLSLFPPFGLAGGPLR
jgi:hypothetical protein